MGSYTQLSTDVLKWSHRPDIEPEMDTFLELAEAVINKDLRTLDMETELLDITFDNPYYDLPDDYLEMRSLYLTVSGARRDLDLVSPQILNKRYNFATGAPGAFTVKANQIEFRPGPSVEGPYLGSYTYYSRVPTLLNNTTNDILDKFPLIYLSAMLAQVYLFLQDDTEAAKWSGIFDTQVAAANKSAQGGRYLLPRVRSV